MTISIRRFCASAVLLTLAFGYSSIVSAGGCLINYSNDFVTDFCQQPVDSFYCNALDSTTDISADYFSGGCPDNDDLIGYCVQDGGGIGNEFYYYTNINPIYTPAILESACVSGGTGVWTPGGGTPVDPCEDDDGFAAVRDPLDAEGMPDVIQDAVPDIAVLNLFEGQKKGPIVSVLSGLNGQIIRDIEFFNSNYRPLRLDTGTDSNRDGAPVDPFIAVLAKNRSTGESWVQVRSAISGAKVQSSRRFFSGNYEAIDVAILDDTNGDGVVDDPSVAVLAQKSTSGRQAIFLRSLVTGKKLGNWTITQANSDVIAIVAETVSGTAPNNARLAVLTVKNSGSNQGNSSVLQVRVADGEILSKKSVADSSLEVIDMAVRRGGAGFGLTNAPAIVVLGETSNGSSKVRIRDLKSNSKLRADITMLSDPWKSRFVGVAPDLSGNGQEDIIDIAFKPSSGDVRIKVRDADTGDTSLTVDMDKQAEACTSQASVNSLF